MCHTLHSVDGSAPGGTITSLRVLISYSRHSAAPHLHDASGSPVSRVLRQGARLCRCLASLWRQAGPHVPHWVCPGADVSQLGRRHRQLLHRRPQPASGAPPLPRRLLHALCAPLPFVGLRVWLLPRGIVSVRCRCTARPYTVTFCGLPAWDWRPRARCRLPKGCIAPSCCQHVA